MDYYTDRCFPPPPPDCSALLCGWAFLGTQLVMTSDSGWKHLSTLDAGSTARGQGGSLLPNPWMAETLPSAKVDVSTAPAGTHHAFPADRSDRKRRCPHLVDGCAAPQTVAWTSWNVYFAVHQPIGGSLAGATEADLSTFRHWILEYIFTDGFRFPFGDYYELDIDEQGTNHVVFGKALATTRRGRFGM